MIFTFTIYIYKHKIIDNNYKYTFENDIQLNSRQIIHVDKYIQKYTISIRQLRSIFETRLLYRQATVDESISTVECSTT